MPSAELKGAAELRAKIAALGPKGLRLAGGALTRVAAPIKMEAFNRCPKEKGGGILRDSIKQLPAEYDGDEVSVTIVAGDGECNEYAVAVHEHPSDASPPSWLGKIINWTYPGTGPKFLEGPVLEAADTLCERVSKHIDLAQAVK